MKKALQVAMFSLFTVIGFNAQANEHQVLIWKAKKSPSITIRLLP